MGTGIKKAVLICSECWTNVFDTNALIAGSSDPNDVRCPQCGSSQFSCGYCLKVANRFAKDGNKLTWNCDQGCNP